MSANEELEVSAAWLYYMDGLTQAQIAERLFVSRPTAGRLISRAKEKGIVRISFDPLRLASFGLGIQVQDAYGLNNVVVVPDLEGASSEAQTERVATAAASFVSRFLRPGAIIGVAWGETVHRALVSLAEPDVEGVTFVTVTGGIEHITRQVTRYPEIAERLRAIPAPLVVSNAETAALLRAEESVSNVIELGRSADVILTSVGAAEVDGSSVKSGLATNEEIRRFVGFGAVGDMLGEWYNSRGEVLTAATSTRRIGMELADLRRVPEVIGIASGKDKRQAVRGAIAGGYIKSLVADRAIAEYLLETACKHPASSW